MSLRRIIVLLGRELRVSAGNFLILFGLVVPLAFSLLVNLVFGDLFAGKPRLAFYDPIGSQFTELMGALPHLSSEEYTSLEEMKADVEKGIIETGYVVPQGFDEAVKMGTAIEIEVYTWGETPFKNRLIADTAIANAIGQMAGLEQKVKVEVHQLGQAEVASLAQRLLPMLVLMSMMLGGVMSPAISMIQEKEQHSLWALTVTPARLSEVFAAKTLLGVLLAFSTALITLGINRAFGSQPLLLALVLLVGALAVGMTGTLMGALVKDMNLLLAALKAGGLFLFAPGILELVPQAPEWIARVFPTYYILNPIMQVAERGARLGEIWGDLLVLGLMLAALAGATARVISQQQKHLALL